MAWNEPGGNKDPWGGNRGNQGPPDLDEVLRKLSNKLRDLFGGGGGGDGSGGGGGSSHGARVAILGVAALAVLVWLGSGFYIIEEGQRGVVLRLGEFAKVTQPGPHWHIPYPVDSVEEVNVDQVRSAQHQATMLTQDENIVDIDLAVQYRVKDASDYVFNVRSPDMSVREVMESAIREVVGKSKMDFVLAEGRAEIALDTENLMQDMLDSYEVGLVVNNVNLQQAQPPEPVQAAFEDAVKAREDEVRFRNEAQAYANSILPKARGEAARIVEDAKAYREEVVARAEGQAARFQELLAEYQQDPEIMRERLYLETIESVMTNSSKVLVDVQGSNNLMYLPVDRLMQQRQGSAGKGGSSSGSAAGNSQQSTSSSSNSSSSSSRRRMFDPRSREVR